MFSWISTNIHSKFLYLDATSRKIKITSGLNSVKDVGNFSALKAGQMAMRCARLKCSRLRVNQNAKCVFKLLNRHQLQPEVNFVTKLNYSNRSSLLFLKSDLPFHGLFLPRGVTMKQCFRRRLWEFNMQRVSCARHCWSHCQDHVYLKIQQQIKFSQSRVPCCLLLKWHNRGKF